VRNILRPTLGILAIFVTVNLAHVPTASAQFGIKIPKVPSIGKDKNDSKDSKDSKGTPAAATAASSPPVPAEISGISPSVVPAGWEGDVVFTGKNFLSSMTVDLDCTDYHGLKTRDFKVTSSTSATLHLQLPEANFDERDEAKCTFTASQTTTKTDISPTKKGTPSVQQVSVSLLTPFSISNSSPIARGYAACFVAEGNLPLEDFYPKLLDVMAKQNGLFKCRLLVSPASAKYETLFDVPASGIKAIEPIELVPGAAMGFRLVLTNGKIYGFGDMTQGLIAKKIKSQLKK
jgi:hypothetical protein